MVGTEFSAAYEKIHEINSIILIIWVKIELLEENAREYLYNSRKALLSMMKDKKF